MALGHTSTSNGARYGEYRRWSTVPNIKVKKVCAPKTACTF